MRPGKSSQLRWPPMMQMLLEEILPHRKRFAVCLGLLIGGAVLSSAKFVMLKHLVQAGLDGHGWKIVWMLSATVGCWLFAHATVYSAAVVGLQFDRLVGITVVKRTLFALLQRSSLSLRQLEGTETVHFLRTGLRLVGRTLQALLQATSQLLIAGFSVAAAFLLQPLLGACCLALAAPALLLAARHLAAQRRAMAENLEGDRVFHLRLCRLFNALPQVKIYGAGPVQLERLTKVLQRQKRSEQVALSAQRRAVLEMQVCGAVCAILVMALGAAMLLHGATTVATLASILVIQRAIFGSLGQALFYYGQAEESSEFLVAMRASRQRATSITVRDKSLQGPIRTLECRNAALASGDRALLHDVTCRLERGRLYGVVGPSGSGKTMLLHLFSANAPPQIGQLLVNGVPLEELDGESVARRIALVTWPPLVLQDTLAANLRIARPRASDAELVATLRQVAFAQDLERLEPLGGLETRLGRDGVQLSVGQLQRLALARALLRAPDVLLVDDVMTGLDPVSIQQVLDSLRAAARNCIVVAVASSETALENYDEWLITADGRLLAQTTLAAAERDPRLAVHFWPQTVAAA